jgi:hypothetical protein
MKLDPSFGQHVDFLRTLARSAPAEHAALAALRVASGALAERNPKRTAMMLREMSARLRRIA